MAPSALDLPGLEEHFAKAERKLVAKLGKTHATMASDFPEEQLKLYGELSDRLRGVRQHLQVSVCHAACCLALTDQNSQ